MMLRFIIEVMGRPEEVVKQTLKGVVNSLNKRYKVNNSEISDIEKIEGADLLSGFVEVEFSVDNFEQGFLALLDYGPTVAEVIKPDKVNLNASELQNVFAEVITKLNTMSKAIQALKVENFKLLERIGPINDLNKVLPQKSDKK